MTRINVCLIMSLEGVSGINQYFADGTLNDKVVSKREFTTNPPPSSKTQRRRHTHKIKKRINFLKVSIWVQAGQKKATFFMCLWHPPSTAWNKCITTMTCYPSPMLMNSTTVPLPTKYNNKKQTKIMTHKQMKPNQTKSKNISFKD